MFFKKASYDRKKLILLSCAACCIAACYAILRPLKSSIFFQLVGKEYYPLTKFCMALFVAPLIGWFSKLVDNYKKHVVLYVLFSIYTIICLIFACLFAHPVWGVANTQPHPFRLLGWLFSISMDFYPTFVIGTFWAFINSISTPNFAKNSYGIIYAFVKIGSLCATIFGMYITYQITESNLLIPGFIVIAALLTFVSIFFISRIIKKIPESQLTGYKGNMSDVSPQKTTGTKKAWGIFEGIRFMLTKPYVFGIFFLFYCYDFIFTIVEYQAQVLLSVHTKNIANLMNFYLFSSATVSQLMGLVIALFITSRVLNSVKMKFALLIMPIFSVGLVAILLLFPNLTTMLAAMTLLPAIHFSINSPLREMLFIPTIKSIQFKSKAWMDSFGRTVSKSSASTFNMLFAPQSSVFLAISTMFSLVLATTWVATAHAMGKEYKKTIDNKDIIGGE